MNLVIFGCNGVLVDAELPVARVRATALAVAGATLEPEVLAERFGGQSTHDMMIALERETGVPLQASMIEQIERQIDKRLQREGRAADGARELVQKIPSRCVCAHTTRARLDLLLAASGLRPFFENRSFSLDDIDGEPLAPAPDLYLHAATTLGAEPAGCFVVEDKPAAVAAAIAAGMRAIGYTGGAHSYPGHADMLTDAGAETVVNRWRDFPPVLAALQAWRES